MRLQANTQPSSTLARKKTSKDHQTRPFSMGYHRTTHHWAVVTFRLLFRLESQPPIRAHLPLPERTWNLIFSLVTFDVLVFEALIGEVVVGVGAVPVRVFILLCPSLQSPPYDDIPLRVGLRVLLALQLYMMNSVENSTQWHVTCTEPLFPDSLNIEYDLGTLVCVHLPSLSIAWVNISLTDPYSVHRRPTSPTASTASAVVYAPSISTTTTVSVTRNYNNNNDSSSRYTPYFSPGHTPSEHSMATEEDDGKEGRAPTSPPPYSSYHPYDPLYGRNAIEQINERHYGTMRPI
jgi:hypothetical protein